ncbi:bestrophin family protein [Ramlibacter albus]|uniref:Bestrophin n=1 Tax=Ramlibacter albus TaxID=2079448 RepID=A0A923S2S9_9BURK|nr:bestrophin family ion channel [Ramlibacter albus]MBC5765710.1 bestrophin [Ramlibacter albus]
MIVRDRPHGLQLIFTLRGSVLPHIVGKLAICTAFAIVVTITHGVLYEEKVALTAAPFSLIGLALAIFLGFRNSAAYDRYWEARKLWGDLVYRSRALARQLQSLTTLASPAAPDDGADVRRAIMLRAIAFASTLRHELRGTDAAADLRRLLPADEAAAGATAARGSDYLLRRMALDLGSLVRAGHLQAPLAANIDDSLTAMGAVAAGCERIQRTPIPFAYTLLLHRTAWLYCLLLPFGLVDTVGAMTPFVVVIVAYTFFGLAALGDEIEEPFGTADNHLPLDALCREIEASVLDALGVRELPPRLVPVDGRLT